MGFLAAAILVSQIAWAKRNNPKFIFLLVIMCVFVLANTHSSYFKRIETITNEEEAESIRIKLWRQAGKLMSIHPYFGVGPGNYIPAKTYYNIPGNKTHVAHNAFFQVGAENGIPAMIIFSFLGMFTYLKLKKLEFFFKKNDTNLFAICQAAKQCVMVVMLSMFFLSQQHNHFYMLLAAITASLERQYRYQIWKSKQ
jgi:O-antigen ligase